MHPRSWAAGLHWIQSRTMKQDYGPVRPRHIPGRAVNQCRWLHAPVAGGAEKCLAPPVSVDGLGRVARPRPPGQIDSRRLPTPLFRPAAPRTCQVTCSHDLIDAAGTSLLDMGDFFVCLLLVDCCNTWHLWTGVFMVSIMPRLQ